MQSRHCYHLHGVSMHRWSTIPRPFAAARTVCLCTLVLACGGSGDKMSNDSATVAPGAEAVVATPGDACALLPAVEVEQVIGVSVRDSLALSMTGADGSVTLSQCNYATADNPAALAVMLRRNADDANPAIASQGVRQSLVESQVDVQDVAGLGDVAFWGGNQLHVFAPKWHLTISPIPSAGLEQARALATRALPKL